jgi:hypothetical protein
MKKKNERQKPSPLALVVCQPERKHIGCRFVRIPSTKVHSVSDYHTRVTFACLQTPLLDLSLTTVELPKLGSIGSCWAASTMSLFSSGAFRFRNRRPSGRAPLPLVEIAPLAHTLTPSGSHRHNEERTLSLPISRLHIADSVPGTFVPGEPNYRYYSVADAFKGDARQDWASMFYAFFYRCSCCF